MSNFSLKDQLFNRERVTYLAGLFAEADETFDEKGFVRDVMRRLQKLELKQRIVWIAECLERHLDTDFVIAARQIKQALPPPLDPNKTDDDFGDFIIAPLGEFVVRNGLSKRHRKRSLGLLKQITKRFSMEDAIRAFINEFPDETLSELMKWATDKNYHVRRLVSEGTRPALPWSGRIGIALSDPIPMLDTLHGDGTRYVTRSVANHLNDISKSDPDLVIDTLQSWKTRHEQDADELAWISRHSLRTLIKRGHPRALAFLGFRSKPKLALSGLSLRRAKLKPGDTLEFGFELTAKRDESLIVDFVIDFVKANGKTSPKVFKLGTYHLKKGECAAIEKRHKLHANATTFKLYSGKHHLSIQVNGNVMATIAFDLAAAR